MNQKREADSPNILLITIDSLRYDHLGCYGYHRNTSPNIDALAARGVKFMQAISNGGHTPTSFPAIMASALPPLKHAEAREILQQNVTLAEVLKNSGYDTAAFHSNPLLSHFHGYQKGFNVFDDSFRQLKPWRVRLWLRGIAKSAGGFIGRAANEVSFLLKPLFSRVLTRPIISAEELTDRSVFWFEKHKGGFFLWLHYMDVHHPYMPTTKYINEFCNNSVSRRQMNILWRKMTRKPNEVCRSERETLINLYDADIKYTDEVIGRLLDRLGDQLDNTVVIITSDHGDEFGEHGKFGHETVYDGILRVPLIIAGPSIEGNTVVKQQVSLIDLAPTIMGIVGIRSPRSFQGRSLLSMIEGKEESEAGTISTIVHFGMRQREVDIAYRIPGWKYIRTESLNGSSPVVEEVYDLKKDPGETNNLHGEGNGEANRFELEARKKIAEFKKRKFEENSGYEKQRIRAKLSKMKKP